MNALYNQQIKTGTIKTFSQISNNERVFSFFCKRLFDLTAATLLLLVLFPIMLIVGLLIKLDSKGPAIFVQKRVGARPHFKNGRVTWETQTFSFFKFRSMVQNADQGLHQAHIQSFIQGTLDTSCGTVKLVGDPRITRIGAFLRKTSLDELPQLLNVLLGTMSLVGPRPVPTYEVESYETWHYERLNAMPGITGFWQVKGRGIVSFDEMIKMDIEYVRTRSFMLDIKLLLLTFFAVFSCRGAR